MVVITVNLQFASISEIQFWNKLRGVLKIFIQIKEFTGEVALQRY